MAAVSPGVAVATRVRRTCWQGEGRAPDTMSPRLSAGNHFVGEGRFINDGDVRRSAAVMVLGHSVMESLFPFTDPLGKVVTLSGRKYEVVGIMEKQGTSMFESSDSHVYLPLTTFDNHYPWIKRERGVNIATVPKRPEWVNQIVEEGTTILRARRKVPFNKPNDFGIMTPDKLIGNFRAITGGITLAMLFISSIALLVGGVGVMNIMLVSVTERTGRQDPQGHQRPPHIVQQFLVGHDSGGDRR
jgi:putative ABC transport system permease protein